MLGQRIGYVRVSTLDQNPERQLEQVTLDRVFTDHASGKDIERPQLEALLSFVREGDTLVVHSMDRLARNLEDLRHLVRAVTRHGVRVEFVTENLTFTGEDSPMATLLLSVMGAFAEFERALIRERQREGIALAKRRGVYRGRKRQLSEDAAARARGRWRAEGGGGPGVRHQPRNPVPIPGTKLSPCPAALSSPHLSEPSSSHRPVPKTNGSATTA
jgi:DNA invertase Pin-like site-specific DNA recombinase